MNATESRRSGRQWTNQAGRKGRPGRHGRPRPIGPTGPQGPQGLAGGETGPQGNQGAMGPTGAGISDPVFPDNLFRVTGNVDSGGRLAFQVDGFAASTTRTLVVPDADVAQTTAG